MARFYEFGQFAIMGKKKKKADKKQKKLDNVPKKTLLKSQGINHALHARDKSYTVRNMLHKLINEQSSLSKGVITQLQTCIIQLDEAINHAGRSVPWFERIAHDRIQKANISKTESTPPIGKRKSLDSPSIVEKKKTRTAEKRLTVMREEERRRLDGRAAAIEKNKLKNALRTYQPGAKLPSTPEEIGKILKAATECVVHCHDTLEIIVVFT